MTCLSHKGQTFVQKKTFEVTPTRKPVVARIFVRCKVTIHTYIYIHRLDFLSNFRVACNIIKISS